MAVGGVSMALGLSLACLPGGPTLTFYRQAEVDSTTVHLGEIADVSALPAALRERATQLPVARISPGQAAASLSSRRLTERARAQMPVLAPWLPLDEDAAINVSLRGGAPASPAKAETRSREMGCLTLARAVSAGKILASGDITPADCATAPAPTALRFDRAAGAMRAIRPLHPDEVIAAPSGLGLPDIAPGQRLFIETSIGAVRIQRQVEALQAAAPGQPLFVRAADGAVFAVPPPEIAP